MTSPLVWLITGTSSGLGRQLALEALKRGEKVIATGRACSIAKLDDMKEKGAKVIELDVTSPLETLHEVAKKAVAIYGKIDVLVNNAGYMLVGAIEESTPQETFDQFNTNVFGALNVTRAFLPSLYARKEDRNGYLDWVPRWLEVNAIWRSLCHHKMGGISETLHEEISPLGLRSICIDFGAFRTSFLDADQRAPEVARIADYKGISDRVEAALQVYNGKQPGDPLKGMEVIVDVVKGEGGTAGKPFPAGLALRTDCLNVARTSSQNALKRLDEWQEFSVSTDQDK